ncbi:PREDICTED: interferon-induced guanylate-binding protein 1-like [Elephantulus edwardii]|uniref:interferon-induced guanylate-binding protein 1-like n=1 Tax=Elephantulus edwardii TaxID=28737 RepID=UPI0003F0DC33|nr:PREDICTED: interferon-induced guanylate-binding protein 1-like [Elephantulus edwardii]
MASEKYMPGPVCLIENIDLKLKVNPEALKILSDITQPVVVVAIVGLYRTGKSYLMNKLAGKKKGFCLGSTVQSQTKGIWMWCVPHPTKSDQTLVLLDTEGLGDVEKGDNQNDSWIFALAILLSSTFVYNSMGTINQQALDQLHYVTELTDRIRVNSGANKDEDSAEFIAFFPDFVWTVRDFYLDLDINGKAITADEYLENSLKLIPGTSQKEKKFNLPRLCIRKFFPKKKCFIFDRPAHKKQLACLETLHDDELDPEFVQQVADFCSFIFSHSKVKTLSGNIKVNGPRLENLVQTYVNAISSGDLPCMENAVLALAQIENSAAVQKAIAHYDQQMGQKVQLPTETLQELLDLHRASEKEAIEVFIKNSFKDVDQLFQKKLATELRQKLDDFCKQNMQVSTDHCSALLKNIFSPLEEEVSQGIYSKAGGYRVFVQKMKELKEKYQQEPRKGIQAEESLQTYLMSKESMMDAILQTDQSLQEKEKEIEVERVKAESAKASQKLLEEIQKKNEQMMQEKEKSYQEHIRQLTEKMEKDRIELVEKQERILAAKLQEQEKLLREGFLNESRQLQSEINNLRKKWHEPRLFTGKLKSGEVSALPVIIEQDGLAPRHETLPFQVFKELKKSLVQPSQRHASNPSPRSKPHTQSPIRFMSRPIALHSVFTRLQRVPPSIFSRLSATSSRCRQSAL